MLKSKTFILLLVLLMGLLTAAVVFADPIVVDVTEPFVETASATNRLFRDGTASDCSGKAFPGPFSSGGFPYSVEGPFGPVLEDGCITIDWDPLTCGTGVHPMVYRDSFDPAWGPDNATNYLGDSGSSQLISFSFPVVAGDTFVLILQSVANSAPTCDYHYSFTYDRVPDAPEVTPEPPPSGCTLTLPAGSVVGDAPFETQVYYEPGNASPGLFLNPGTYPVIGQDPTETYYQIMLACQFLWVRKDSMQPSYAAPQNGAPLPTTIIGGSASGDGATAGATD